MYRKESFCPHLVGQLLHSPLIFANSLDSIATALLLTLNFSLQLTNLKSEMNALNIYRQPLHQKQKYMNRFTKYTQNIQNIERTINM